jgi:enoyl-CoA hydratase/carnithine racemase
MNESAIHVDVDGHVATITLNRPDAMNAMTVEMIEQFVDAVDGLDGLDGLDADDDVRCVIVTGAGRHFCAGADLSRRDDSFAWERWEADDRGLREGRNGGGTLTMRIYDSPKPFVAAINGSAVGFGLTMTLPMDVRVCADHAKLGLVFSRRGMVIDAASGWFLPRIVSMSWAAEWAYSGRLFSADDAVRSGLVRDALPAADVLPAARRIAEEIAEANPVSVSLTKALLWRGATCPTPWDVHRIDTAALAELGHRPDAAEGVRAFFEKRTPHFESRVGTDMPSVYPWWEDPDAH